jgi:alkanesulfonate monooxygenase SsuD/methylene tetrahydromethanopterin reductase-like flavin-dependent oxidoreductase (luciferase family)
MPRPIRPGGPPFMMAVLVPEAIYHCTKRGFHIQTTPLSGDHQHMLDQVNAFHRGRAELGAAGRDLTLSLSRVTFVAKNAADRRAKIEAAHDYYRRFDNVFTGPGLVQNGMIAPLPRKQTAEELGQGLLICTPSELIDKLGPYAEAGVDRVILNINFGASQAETLDCIQCFAEEVMPHFAKPVRSMVAE